MLPLFPSRRIPKDTLRATKLLSFSILTGWSMPMIFSFRSLRYPPAQLPVSPVRYDGLGADLKVFSTHLDFEATLHERKNQVAGGRDLEEHQKDNWLLRRLKSTFNSFFFSLLPTGIEFVQNWNSSMLVTIHENSFNSSFPTRVSRECFL